MVSTNLDKSKVCFNQYFMCNPPTLQDLYIYMCWISLSNLSIIQHTKKKDVRTAWTGIEMLERVRNSPLDNNMIETLEALLFQNTYQRNTKRICEMSEKRFAWHLVNAYLLPTCIPTNHFGRVVWLLTYSHMLHVIPSLFLSLTTPIHKGIKKKPLN